MSDSSAQRIVVFGATGHLGQELIARLESAPFAVDELVGVVSGGSAGADFDFRGEEMEAEAEWPALRKGDLVFVCTPAAIAGEVIRAALRAQAPCIDCSGSMASQPEVFVPARFRGEGAEGAAGSGDDEIKQAAAMPLASLPSAAVLAWRPIIDALLNGPGLSRVVATRLCGASALGRDGLVALSEESIALFNQSAVPDPGPAGQAVAFDVVPGGLDEGVVEAHAARVFGSALRLAVTSVQIPTFVGEGAVLNLELASPLEEAPLRALLDGAEGLDWGDEGPGSRGLVAIESGEEGAAEGPFGPTLRDGSGQDDVIVGRLAPDASLAAGLGWRLWLSYDPARLMAEYAVGLAGLRLAGS